VSTHLDNDSGDGCLGCFAVVVMIGLFLGACGLMLKFVVWCWT
jgi:hypothetical protein